MPSAHVTVEAFENFSTLLLAGIEAARPFDAVYLDLHGAMVTEHLEDGEGELLKRVRAAIGPRIPLVASLDLHSNTAEMLEHADGLLAYRTYPHLDMADIKPAQRGTWTRCCAVAHVRQGAAAFTLLDAADRTVHHGAADKGVYEALQHLETRAGVRHVSFTPGFPPADIHHCGPVVVAYGDTQADADAAADALYHYIAEREEQFVVPLLTPAEAVATAMQANAGKPIVLADVQDNCGAGATSDTTGILAELVRQGAKDAVVGVLVDAEAARAAHAVGVGGTLHLAIGGKLLLGRPTVCGRVDGDGTLGRSLYLHRALLQGSHDESRAHGLSQNRWRGRHHLDTPHASCGSGHVSSHWLRADCAKNSRA